MKKLARLPLLFLFLASVALPAAARRDPLNNAEIDELRDAAQEPAQRIPLFVKFIRVRMVSLEQLSDDPRIIGGRAAQIHDLLEDIDTLVLEMDDNIDQYAKLNADLRKALPVVIQMDTELQAKLKDMKARKVDPGEQAGSKGDLKSYRFALDNALESATSSLENAQELLQEQQVAFQKKKK